MTATKPEAVRVSPAQKYTFLGNKYIRMTLIAVAILVFAIVSGYTYTYASTPAAVRSPQFDHLHFRMQLIVDNKAVNFADKKYQQGYSTDNCNADLTINPFHFHDNKDQFVHVHWKNMSGGMVLKYYGWNNIGGVDGMLGTRFDAFPNLQTVHVHGNDLPHVTKGDSYYVYTGDETGYKARSFDDFNQQTLESFFDKHSNVKPDEAASLLDKIFPKASAHAGHEHGGADADVTEDLAEINNLLGNVVIFAQKSKPTDQQVKDRFADLEPLSASTCAG